MAARRRLKKGSEALEVSAFINLIVVLVPFLLSTAVFSRIAVVDLTLPAKSANYEGLKENDLKLEVVVRHDAIEVGDKIGGLISRIPNTADGATDTTSLNTVMLQVKQKFPAVTSASVLPEPNIPYDTMIHVMDAMRTAKTANGGTEVVDVDLFPAISIGDAPVRH
ncbi:ExbD/TolR family protein [Scleromatobacter humisilvae]|uniref:Biopolymer transporter ExbD n=1 Tax=Scleromatobacter humisilvae TaxID=2897159 RepID=A0A9X1YRV5_9BURK|nr:biopolymer transporter ExbD [Scleromatobacter humisilvae]MCK9687636.1 biopolymer transporter ExbD [Scleromatobacter humisilvae]